MKNVFIVGAMKGQDNIYTILAGDVVTQAKKIVSAKTRSELSD